MTRDDEGSTCLRLGSALRPNADAMKWLASVATSVAVNRASTENALKGASEEASHGKR